MLRPRSTLHRHDRHLARSAAALAIALAALAVTACSCPQSEVLVDGFEGCTGTCGWAVTGGGAAVTSTILPGEHGLRMDGGLTASKAIPSVTIDTSFSLELVADCPAGLAATLAASVPSGPDITLAVMLAIDNSLDSNGDAPDYSGASYVPLVAAINLPMGVLSAVVHQVTLQPSAGASCTVDAVRLTSVSPCGN